MANPAPVATSRYRVDRDPALEPNLLDLINIVLRHVRAIGLTVLVCEMALLGPAIKRERSYSSVSTFINESRRTTSSVAGVAAQFGLNIGGLDAPTSPDFYVDLVTSSEILEPVVLSQYSVRTDTGLVKGNIVDVLGIHGGAQEWRVDKAILALKSMVTSSASPKTGVVSLTVTSHLPSLARDIASQILIQLNEFNLRGRQAHAAMERKFTENRLGEAVTELRAAEDRLLEFRAKNHFVTGYTRLQTEQDRLTRDVAMRQQVFTTLAQSYEQARIDELRNIPVLTVLQRPHVPLAPNSRRLVKLGTVALGVGLVLGLILALTLEYIRKLTKIDEAGVAEFRVLRQRLAEDLRGPFRRRPGTD